MQAAWVKDSLGSWGGLSLCILLPPSGLPRKPWAGFSCQLVTHQLQLLEFVVTELLLLKQGFVCGWLLEFKMHKTKENGYLWTCFGVASL